MSARLERARKTMVDLPPRAGAKPRTTSTTPHQQQSQNPVPQVYDLLLSKAFEFPHVERRPSAISVPGAQAPWLSEAVAGARAEAFLIGREFAHVHPPYDGSMHMMLPPEAVEELLGKNWGELHPMARRGLIPATAVMVYAPRDAAEVDIVLHLIAASYRFALGDEPRGPHSAASASR
jgi:phospholipase/carboxylesterase